MELINYTKQFGFIQSLTKSGIGKKTSKFLGSQTANKANMAFMLGSGAIGLGSALLGAKKQLSDKAQFTVVYKSATGPARLNTKAITAIDAINNAKAKANGGTGFRAFRIPDQENEALQYYQSL